MNCRLQQPRLQGVDKNENLPTKSCVIIIARTTLKCNRKQVGFLPKQGAFFGQNVEKAPKSRRRTPFAKKIAKQGLTRLTGCGILFSQRWLDKPNHRCTRKAEASARASAKPKFVAAGPLHLAYARPLCGLKAPLGLSLLRKRQFLHSILFFQVRYSSVCSVSRCAAQGAFGTALCAKKTKTGRTA